LIQKLHHRHQSIKKELLQFKFNVSQMANKTNQDPLFSRQEAAQYLGLSTKTLATWASTGRQNLPMVKIGSRAKYRKSDLDAFIAANAVRHGETA